MNIFLKFNLFVRWQSWILEQLSLLQSSVSHDNSNMLIWCSKIFYYSQCWEQFIIVKIVIHFNCMNRKCIHYTDGYWYKPLLHVVWMILDEFDLVSVMKAFSSFVITCILLSFDVIGHSCVYTLLDKRRDKCHHALPFPTVLWSIALFVCARVCFNFT